VSLATRMIDSGLKTSLQLTDVHVAYDKVSNQARLPFVGDRLYDIAEKNITP